MDSLLAAIVGAPDDDAPRLVWADREGGERGELVVLQCKIAAREGSRADRVGWQARVRELLRRFQAPRETMVRGFVERAEVELDEIVPALLERLPLLRELVLASWYPPCRPPSYDAGTLADALAFGGEIFTRAFAQLPPDRIRRLDTWAEVHEHGDYEYPDDDHPVGDAVIEIVAATPALAGLRELRVFAGNVTHAAIPHLARLRGLVRLGGGMRLTGAHCVALLRAVPSLTHFGPWDSRLTGAELATLLAAVETQRLRGLELWANGLTEPDLRRIAETPFIALEDLGIGCAEEVRLAHDAIVDSPHLASLASLDLASAHGDPPPRLPPLLRALRLTVYDDTTVEALLAARTLEELVATRATDDQLARLRTAIPQVNDGAW